MDKEQSTTQITALKQFIKDLKVVPTRFKTSMIRTGIPNSDRTRSNFIFSNLFLHIHTVRVHPWSLKWRTTFGLGIIAASAFLLTLITGVLLMFYYKPYSEIAYISIKDIHFIVAGGRLIRNIHRWSANIMVVSVLLHMARVFFTASYRSPREFNWIIGLLLLVVTLGLSFTGYLLPWDQLAFWAITIGANIAESAREVTDMFGITSFFDIGGFQKLILLGSDQVGPEALIRFYLLHVMILPIALVSFLGLHFWRIRKDGGLARPETADEHFKTHYKNYYPVFSEAPEKTYSLAALVRGKTPAVGRGPEITIPSMPHLMYAELALFMLTAGLASLLSLWMDAPLKELANPMVPENPAKAPWYFLGLQELVSHSAFMGGIGIPAIVILGLGMIPYLDRETKESGKWFGGPGGLNLTFISFLFGLITVLSIEAFAIHFGWIRQWFPQVPQLVITLINPGTVLTLIYILFSITVIKQYNSIRAGATALFCCFLISFLVLTIIGIYFRGPNWDFYWSPSLWPRH